MQWGYMMRILPFKKSKMSLIVLLYYVTFSVVFNPLFSQIETVKEYELKATFIYHFTKYIQWPDDHTSETFDIAVFGDSKIIAPLEKIAKIRLIDDRKIRIKHFDHIQNIDSCHILFISASQKRGLSRILKEVQNKNILTISDSEGFARRGVAINLVIVEGKIKFEINSKALERAGLQASSQLVKLAKLIDE